MRIRPLSATAGLLPLLAASIAGAVQLRGDAVGTVGGIVSNATHRLGFTVGLAAEGYAFGPLRWEFAGFWLPNPQLGSAVDGSSAAAIPLVSGLDAVAPNPMREHTRVAFRVAGARGQPVPTRLDLFDPAGRHVVTLLDAALAPGYHGIEWNGVNDRGTPLAAGCYYLRLVAGSRSETRRLLLVH